MMICEQPGPRKRDTIPRPLIKYPGGKRWAVDLFLMHIGAQILASRKRYFEPFAGGAALFFRLAETGQSRDAVLSDANEELVSMYCAVRDNVESLIRHLEYLDGLYRCGSPDQRATMYYDVRSGGGYGPARTIFLNKTGLNGLFRVNRDGAFNVPHGRTASGGPPVICDADNLRACSRALQDVAIGCADFAEMLLGNDVHPSAPKAGDLVYIDSPYVPEDGKRSFVEYVPKGFSDDRQTELAQIFRELVARGVYVCASNSRTARVRELYHGFRQIEIERPGGNNSDTAKRQHVPELLMLGWERT